MRVVWLYCLLVLLACGSCSVCLAAPLMLSDFETDADLAQWEPTDGSALSRTTAHATEGSYSCQVVLPVTTYPGMYLVTYKTHDWSAYDVLRWDVYNPESYALTFNLEISDSQTGYDNRHSFGAALIPGLNHLEMDLHTMLRNSFPSSVDPGDIQRFTYWVNGLAGPSAVYVDNMRLEDVQDDPGADAARGIYKFDFGPADSPRWTDFYGIDADTTYPAAAGPFGWVSDSYRYSGDFGGPDDLVSDFVRPLPCCPDDTNYMDFRLDVANGQYVVYVIARSGNLSEMPVLPYQVIAEADTGSPVTGVDVPMDASTFFSTSYYYRGMDEDYPLSANAWERFENSNFPVSSFTVNVTDGNLDLRFLRAWAYALIVYPNTPTIASEMTTRLAQLAADRKAEFEGSYYINQPQSLTFTPTAEDSARGYAAWPASVMDPCHPDTLPPATRPTPALSTFASQGEYRPVSLALRPLADVTGVSMEVTDLSDGLGHTIPTAEIEHHYVRYLATGDSEFFGAGVLSWKPRLVQDTFPLAVKAQVTKQLWLTVHVPAGTPAGTYSGTVTVHASSGDMTVPLTVQVYSFALDAANDSAFGWYYMDPADRYCLNTRWFPDLATRADEILRLDFESMRKHGFNSLQFPTPSLALDGAGHITSIDMSALERYVVAMREVGFGGGSWLGQLGTIGLSDRLVSGGLTEFGSTFNTEFQSALSQIVNWGETATDGAPLAFYLIDEPRESDLNSWNRNFADTMRYVDLANAVPGATNTVTVMGDLNGSVDYTPFADALHIMQTHPTPNSAGLISAAYAQGKPNWFYNTGGDLRTVYGFYQYKYGGGNGAWEWHYDWLDGDMFDTFPYSPFNNHWRYTYPSPTGPVPTLSYELASLGITDYRYAKTLSRMAASAHASGDTDLMAWADQADALLAAIKSDTPAYSVDTDYATPFHFAGASGATALADAETAMEDYRKQIADLIAALPGDLPTPVAGVTGASLPTSLVWEGAGAGSVTMQNLGPTTWGGADGYQLLASGSVDRWNLLSLPLTTDVLSSSTHRFDLDLTAPPLTTLRYALPVSATSPAATDGMPLLLGVANGSTFLEGGMATNEVPISRFPDVQPELSSAWARTQVEECAGRLPAIVMGYDDGTYRPADSVTRAQMAVYIQRAMKLPVTDYTKDFDDVASTYWAAGSIQTLVDQQVVSGYDDNTYRPEVTVSRDQMAVFVSRGMAGGDANVSAPATVTFTDVPTDFWAWRHINYANVHDVVHGYDASTYQPTLTVDRGQMAVFIYRGFIQPVASAVLLAGPAITAANPATAGQCGWASASSGAQANPGYAYAGFDAVRFGPELAGAGTWDVKFELRPAADPDTPAVGSYTTTVHLTAADLATAKAAASATGNPYYVVSWDLPAGLAIGDYVLVTSAGDGTGAMAETPRRVGFGVVP